MKDIIEKLEVGTQFWDGRFGPFVCTKKPVFEKVNASRDEGYLWFAEDKFGLQVEFMWIEKYSHYGPRIYLEQAYLSPEDFQKDIK